MLRQLGDVRRDPVRFVFVSAYSIVVDFVQPASYPDAMRLVAEYRQHAKQCRDLAARASNPADKKRLKYAAEAWAKMAALRARNLTDKDAPSRPSAHE